MRRKYAVAGRQWFSPLAYFQGPFDDEKGLTGSAQFFHRISMYDNPQIFLTATETGLGLIPTQTWVTSKVRGRQEVLWIPYTDIEQIELGPASRARMPFVTPDSSSQFGEVIVTTKDGRTARFTGTTVAGLSEFLVSLGATIET